MVTPFDPSRVPYTEITKNIVVVNFYYFKFLFTHHGLSNFSFCICYPFSFRHFVNLKDMWRPPVSFTKLVRPYDKYIWKRILISVVFTYVYNWFFCTCLSKYRRDIYCRLLRVVVLLNIRVLPEDMSLLLIWRNTLLYLLRVFVQILRSGFSLCAILGYRLIISLDRIISDFLLFFIQLSDF